MSWQADPRVGPLGAAFTWVPDGNSMYQGVTTVSHTEGATVWKSLVSGKPRWRIWMRGKAYLLQDFNTEDEAKRYVEAMMPFVELGALK